MKSVVSAIFITIILSLVACVTINVYFPEAEAERVADQFIEGVNDVSGVSESAPTDSGALIDPAVAKPIADQTGVDQTVAEHVPGPQAWHWSQLLISAAYAQSVNIDINTPSVRGIQERMRQRFVNELRTHFDSGAIGYSNRAMLAIRDMTAVSLRERNKLKAAVAADNKDRDAVYREIAVTNGHPEWEKQIRDAFALRWIANAQSGWYYQDDSGQWQRK